MTGFLFEPLEELEHLRELVVVGLPLEAMRELDCHLKEVAVSSWPFERDDPLAWPSGA